MIHQSFLFLREKNSHAFIFIPKFILKHISMEIVYMVITMEISIHELYSEVEIV